MVGKQAYASAEKEKKIYVATSHAKSLLCAEMGSAVYL